MANRLVRAGVNYVVPAQPGRPGTPGYYTFVPVYEYITTEGVQSGLQQFADLYGGGGAVYPSTTYEIVRYDRVFVPGTPAVPSVPERRVVSPPPGWNGYARSIRGFVDGVAEFKVSANVAGVVLGLAPVSSPTSGYAHIPAGFLFTGGQVRNKRTNVSYGAFSSSDTFSIRKRGDSVELMQEGGVLATEDEIYPLGQTVYLSAALYSPQDNVFDPEMTPMYYGSSNALLPGLAAFGGDVASASALAVLGGLATVSGQYSARAESRIRGMSGFAADRPLASGRATLVGISTTSYDVPWDIVPNNEALSLMSPLTSSGIMLSGGVGSAQAQLPGISGLAADRPYAAASNRLAGLSARSFDFSQDLGFMFDVIGFGAGISSQIVVNASASFGVGVDFDISATETVDEDVLVTVGLSVPMTVSTIETADARSIFWFDVPMDVPGAFVDTWVVNTASGGSTRYDNYPFESVANIGGYLVGVSDAGIFELSGDSDDGDPINARVDYGLQRFGSGNLKRLEQIYLGIKSTGQMYVKVTAEGASYTYPLRDFSEYMQTQRVTPGKGMRATYFGFELGNTLGSDFELSSFSTLVAETARRI